MEAKKEALILAGMSAMIVLLFLAGVVWVFVGGMGLTLDAIFLVLVCLMMAGVFSLMMFFQLKAAGLVAPINVSRAEKREAAPAESAKEEAK